MNKDKKSPAIIELSPQQLDNVSGGAATLNFARLVPLTLTRSVVATGMMFRRCPPTEGLPVLRLNSLKL